MPTYEYRCHDCGKVFAKIMSFSEHAKSPKTHCPKCKSAKRVTQIPSAFMAQTSKKA